MASNQDIIRKYATRYKDTIITLKREGAFASDCAFNDFPRGCCGDACDLLAKHLLFKGIDTLYVLGDFDGKSHAWLVVKDSRITPPTKITIHVPVNSNQEWGNVLFSRNDDYEEMISVEDVVYTETNLVDGLIVDITADQFGGPSVYVGYMNDFYKMFEFEKARDYEGLRSGRLVRIYNMIGDFLDCQKELKEKIADAINL